MLDARFDSGERKDLELYTTAVRTASGDNDFDWVDEEPREFITYVEHGSIQYLEGSGGRREALPVTYNYERWLSGAVIV